ncbi:hypothetical protein O95_00405, partial [Bartonella henselae JK 53]
MKLLGVFSCFRVSSYLVKRLWRLSSLRDSFFAATFFEGSPLRGAVFRQRTESL